MTVFLAFAEADRPAAAALDRFLERRGHFSELDNGETVLREVEASDAVVLLVSQAFLDSPARLRLEQRALDAWTDGRLVLVRLDDAQPPVGLRDLHSVDAASQEPELAWGDVHEALSAAPLPEVSRAPPMTAPAPPVRARAMAKAGLHLVPIFATLMLLPGLFAIAAAVSIWLANRIAPTPGTFADLVAGIDALGISYGVPEGRMPWLFVIAIVLIVSSAGVLIARLFAGREHKAAEEATAPAPTPQPVPSASDAVFVSYARANAPIVLPVIEAATASGRRFWLDQDGIGVGETWAGEIVRAIRSARGVIVMCSRAAFESDHVKREIYLADRYKKRLVPVFIEDAEPPEDFEYFFAGVQFLRLHETPEPERPAAVLRVLEAA